MRTKEIKARFAVQDALHEQHASAADLKITHAAAKSAGDKAAKLEHEVAALKGEIRDLRAEFAGLKQSMRDVLAEAAQMAAQPEPVTAGAPADAEKASAPEPPAPAKAPATKPAGRRRTT